MAQAGAGIDQGRGGALAHNPGNGPQIQFAPGFRVLVVHQHRHAVRVDAGEIGLDHHLGGDARELRIHPPRRQQRDDLLADALDGDVHSSAWMFATLMISAHCADSARMAAPKSSGELPTTSAPSSVMRFFASGSRSTRITSAWIFKTVSFGVAAGASRPNQLVSA